MRAWDAILHTLMFFEVPTPMARIVNEVVTTGIATQSTVENLLRGARDVGVLQSESAIIEHRHSNVWTFTPEGKELWVVPLAGDSAYGESPQWFNDRWLPDGRR